MKVANPYSHSLSVCLSVTNFDLKRINELKILNGVFIDGKQQHGFTKNKSTVIAGLVLQSLIARAMDDDCYVAPADLPRLAPFIGGMKFATQISHPLYR